MHDTATTVNLLVSEVGRAAKELDYEAIERITTALHECGNGTVFCSGAGTSGIVARKVAHTLNCAGRPAVFLDPAEALHGGTGVLREGDVVILFSKGGETDELLQMIPVMHERRTRTIAVTMEDSGSLARNCDDVLILPEVEEADAGNVIATTSILVMIVAFDGIAMSLMKRSGYSLESFAKTHPGGAVGKRLNRE